MNTEYVNKILEIGEKEICTTENLAYFSKNLPTIGNRELLDFLHTEYKIYTSHITRREFLNIDISEQEQLLTEDQINMITFLTNLIKGCHLIELKYGGSGSTTIVFNLFNSLIKLDVNRAVDLYNWIALYGGNYYIESGVNFEESAKREQENEKNRIEKLVHDQQIHANTVAKKLHNRDLHLKNSSKANMQYNEFKARFKIMNDQELIETFNGDLNKNCWVSARARFHTALHEEFEKRGFDLSGIKTGNSYSLKYKVKLIEKKIVFDT